MVRAGDIRVSREGPKDGSDAVQTRVQIKVLEPNAVSLRAITTSRPSLSGATSLPGRFSVCLGLRHILLNLEGGRALLIMIDVAITLLVILASLFLFAVVGSNSVLVCPSLLLQLELISIFLHPLESGYLHRFCLAESRSHRAARVFHLHTHPEVIPHGSFLLVPLNF